MKRQAIISDIHANAVALEAILKDCQTQHVDEIVCLGDMVGYGPDPVSCVDTIREKCAWSLRGNHEEALFMTFAPTFNQIARDAIQWQKKQLRAKWYSASDTRVRWKWLKQLAPEKTIGRVLYVHGSPRDPLMEYVEETDSANAGFGLSKKLVEIFEKVEWLSFCGHTHRPGVMTEEGLWIPPDDLPDGKYDLPSLQKTLINVGSVGQPRDGNVKGCYVVFDEKHKTLQFRRVPYDIDEAQNRFKTIKKLHKRSYERLAHGN